MARCDWLGSSDKYFVSHLRAVGRGQFAGSASIRAVTTPLGAANSCTFRYSGCWCARFMNSVQIGRALRAPLELNVAIVIEADPNDADQPGGETRKPTVARGTGLAGCWQNESARPHPRARAGAQHFLHHVFHQVGHAGVDGGLAFRLPFVDGSRMLVADGSYETGLHPIPAVYKNRVGASHF